MCLQEGCGVVEEQCKRAKEAVGVLGERLLISLIPVERKVLAVEVTLACVLQSYQRESISQKEVVTCQRSIRHEVVMTIQARLAARQRGID